MAHVLLSFSSLLRSVQIQGPDSDLCECVCVHVHLCVRAERLLSLIMMIVTVAIFGALTEAAPPFPSK